MLSANLLLSAAQQFGRFYNRSIGSAAKEFGLSRIELDILLFLHNNPELDTSRDIAEYRFLAKSYISKGVDLLVKKGYLAVREDVEDRRLLHLEILPAAGDALEAGRRVQKHILEVLQKGGSPEKRRLLEDFLRDMCENIQEEGSL